MESDSDNDSKCEGSTSFSVKFLYTLDPVLALPKLGKTRERKSLVK